MNKYLHLFKCATCTSPIMHLICPPPPPQRPPPPKKKKLHNLCFSFLTGISAAPRETENNAFAKYWRANKVRIHYGKCASGVCIYVNKVNKLANPLSIFSLCVPLLRISVRTLSVWCSELAIILREISNSDYAFWTLAKKRRLRVHNNTQATYLWMS